MEPAFFVEILKNTLEYLKKTQSHLELIAMHSRCFPWVSFFYGCIDRRFCSRKGWGHHAYKSSVVVSPFTNLQAWESLSFLRGLPPEDGISLPLWVREGGVSLPLFKKNKQTVKTRLNLIRRPWSRTCSSWWEPFKLFTLQASWKDHTPLSITLSASPNLSDAFLKIKIGKLST